MTQVQSNAGKCPGARVDGGTRACDNIYHKSRLAEVEESGAGLDHALQRLL